MAMLRARAGGNMVGTSTHGFEGKDDDDAMKTLRSSMKELKNEDSEAEAKKGKELLEDMMENGDHGEAGKHVEDELEKNKDALAFLGGLSGDGNKDGEDGNPLQGVLGEVLKEGSTKKESVKDAVKELGSLMEKGGAGEDGNPLEGVLGEVL